MIYDISLFMVFQQVSIDNNDRIKSKILTLCHNQVGIFPR